MKFKDPNRSGHFAYINNSVLRIMKLILLIMTTFLLQVSASTFAQRITFNKKEASLKQLFLEVKKQTGYNIFWEEGKVNDRQLIDASFKNTPLEVVLDKVLTPQKLTYKLVNKTIVVKKKEPLFFDKVTSFFATVNVTGKVIDAETGNGIPKVTVKLKNSNRMVVANEQGTFMFYGLNDDDILIISAVGYLAQEMKAKDGMVVKLLAATKVLEDVIVSTGYQQLKQKTTTGSYSVITAKEIEETPSVNLMERLEGKVPGVKFDLRNNSIQIRGVSSYNGRPPLLVIDGFVALNQNLTNITSGTLDGNPKNSTQPETSGNAIISTFNPSDIESITFLKDAAATAIWGANAANGVIVVTTKRGKKGTSSINFSTTFSTSAPANFKNMTSMTNQQYIDFEQELFDKKFILNPASDWRQAPVSEAQQLMFDAKSGKITAAQKDAALNVLANRSNTDQLKEYLLQRAVSQQHNLSFSGGAENSSYYVSGNYTKDQPVFRKNSGESYSVLTNLTNDFLNKRLSLSTGLNYTYAKSTVNSAAIQALSVGRYGMAPYQMLVDDEGNRIGSYVTVKKNTADSLIRINKHLPWTYNPIDELNYNNTITERNSIRVNAAIKGKITNWLNLSVSGQLQKSLNDQVLIQNLDSYLGRELYNLGTVPVNGKLVSGFPKGGIYKSTRSNSNAYGLRAQLDIDKNWNDVHRFNMVVGTEISQNKGTGSGQTLYGYNEDVSSAVNVNTTSTGNYATIYGQGQGRFPFTNSSIFRNTTRNLSHYSSAGYSYLNKYFATASVRFDDINLLGVDRRDRATPLWSGGLRWDIKKESFMDKIEWINSLSIRATLGTAGNPPLTSANFSTIAGIGQLDGYTQLPFVYINSPANQDIGWETTKTTNLGIDAGLFNNRLSVGVDIYRKRSYDIIMSLPLNSTYGYSSLSYNAGDLEGHGVELNISGDAVRTKDWNWSSNFNLSYNTNKVTDSRFPNRLANGGVSAIITGLPVDNFFVYRWAGLDDKGQSQIYNASGKKISSKDQTYTVAPEDLVNKGRTTAPYFGGLGTTVSYKNLSLSVRATYYLGHIFLLQTINQQFYPVDNEFSPAQFSGLLANNTRLTNRWRKAGDEATTDIPGITGSSITSISRFMNSDLNVRDAGNIRLQQITLSYRVPGSLLKRTHFIKSIDCGLTVSNLGLLWVANKEGIDPEYQMTNAYNNLPPTKNYVFNLRLSL
ncbi:SusC/RagA family TonB-linked outer membrane protein [Pedobacter hiemivivus]|uniref:SusC/RagA family TonB-linked outer membrane protein n=1 Tax=Pedobacter hiemivivus TaxID=2530454 RepID=A0A4R0MSI8_9SPHI|nr:SusC/RagA family TonB-linked outer membrane protein [Pedobacter hiemivivus]TCC89955.1 SusC/RagA family TonB-linked outer membrane protein [Pedobacter hiemivivus]